MADASQADLNFEDPRNSGGLNAWRESRQRALRDLGEKLGLPLGHQVEVRLSDGVVLRGRLQLGEDTLFIDSVDTSNVEFVVGRATFRHSEIESCVRIQ